jgi:hypothetical protein
MRIELKATGHNVQFVIINKGDAVEQQQKLTDRTSVPLLQDQEDIVVWDMMNGYKDDFYIYDTDGNLAVFLPISGEKSVILSTPEGYQNLKDAILATEAGARDQ